MPKAHGPVKIILMAAAVIDQISMDEDDWQAAQDANIGAAAPAEQRFSFFFGDEMLLRKRNKTNSRFSDNV